MRAAENIVDGFLAVGAFLEVEQAALDDCEAIDAFSDEDLPDIVKAPAHGHAAGHRVAPAVSVLCSGYCVRVTCVRCG